MQLSVPGRLPRMGPDLSVPVIKRVAGPWKRLTMRVSASAHLRGPQVGLLGAGSDIEDISCLWSGPTHAVSESCASKHGNQIHDNHTLQSDRQTRMRPCSISAASADTLRNGIAPSWSSRIGIDRIRAASVRRATTHVTLAPRVCAPTTPIINYPHAEKRLRHGATAMGFWEQGCAPRNMEAIPPIGPPALQLF